MERHLCDEVMVVMTLILISHMIVIKSSLHHQFIITSNCF